MRCTMLSNIRFNLFGSIGAPSQTLLLMVIGVLLFGKRLPEVSRSIGNYILEFKRGLVGLEDDIWSVSAEQQIAPPANNAEPNLEAAQPQIESDPTSA
jgi:sec-independent protein translocase protein TatA